MTLAELVKILTDLGASAIYAKALAENDNSKQQIYLGGSFDALSILPYGEIIADTTPKVPNFKASIKLSWLTPTGEVDPAPHAQLILYPDYPEVRLSGFLRGSRGSPGADLRPIPKAERRHNNAPDGRVLFFAIRGSETVCFLALSDTEIAREYAAKEADLEQAGVFRRVDRLKGSSRAQLLGELAAIHSAGWHRSVRLRSDGTIIPYAAPNGGGYTLEALLGVAPNGNPLPDYLDWEVKAFSGQRITLMTPEPDGGFYYEMGVRKFLELYHSSNRSGALHFSGVHLHGEVQNATKMILVANGFDPASGRIVVATGGIELKDPSGRVAASWSFAKLIDHWQRKHQSTAYVRYERDATLGPAYRYLSPVFLGEGSHFEKFLLALVAQAVVYDPGPSLAASGAVKARSQFRTKLSQLSLLYDGFEAVTL